MTAVRKRETNRLERVLESWKQIAAYLERSERTVRRWEAERKLPVHRRENSRQDTVFAYPHELDSWLLEHTRGPKGPVEPAAGVAAPGGVSSYLAEHDAITRAIDCYVLAMRTGDPSLMANAFHPTATLCGWCMGVEYAGPVEHLFEWVRQNGPAAWIESRFSRIEIVTTIAVVQLETRGWSGRVAPPGTRTSDVFTLVKREGEWKITHKLFHWHC